ncbi:MULTISPECIES: RNA polymerase sigma factor [Sphingobacterium]|uniref:RNA polymerase sigma factor n=1 Tax=Sphingobacterium TaxID=28453 RepID=UPI00104B367E|nr:MULTISPECIES: sigma-70 family RNA polymerase sigma factor [Sphingobacterium]MCW2259533.1 RNA polymerase sigma factor (sigma-70 family) [Sphingobacterium kitahiroshimense]NJI72401.1 sigma-70 family RNA polymerase sigma factor [Sphingobacterium sp. B16(2022)]TCR14021.1 RNA polymerase sigma factor (sigma-70 family) [Sphingobacterium sp. JUb78]
MKTHWVNITKGDKKSFFVFYDAIYRSLFQYGMVIGKDREIVKESIHILFYELWEKHERLPQEIKDPKFYVFVWLKRIIYRQLKSQQSSLESILNEPFEESVEDQKIKVEEIIEKEQLLHAALAKLTKKQRHYIDLKFFQNKSYEEIATEENAAVRTVYNVIYEAIKSLKGNLTPILIFILNYYK